MTHAGGPLSLLPPSSREPVPRPEPGAYLRSKHVIALGSDPALIGNVVEPKQIEEVREPHSSAGQRACYHALGVPSHGPAVLWDATRCRSAAPRSYMLSLLVA